MRAAAKGRHGTRYRQVQSRSVLVTHRVAPRGVCTWQHRVSLPDARWLSLATPTFLYMSHDGLQSSMRAHHTHHAQGMPCSALHTQPPARPPASGHLLGLVPLSLSDTSSTHHTMISWLWVQHIKPQSLLTTCARPLPHPYCHTGSTPSAHTDTPDLRDMLDTRATRDDTTQHKARYWKDGRQNTRNTDTVSQWSALAQCSVHTLTRKLACDGEQLPALQCKSGRE